MAEVLIAGAGIAGSTLAIHLGRMGLSVELFDRARFPREKPCGEGLMPAGVAALERLGFGILKRAAPFYGIRYHFDGMIVEGRFPQSHGLPAAGRGIRRRDLDNALLEEAARTPGVTIHLGARVDGPAIVDGRVTGLMVEGDLRPAPLVVGCDGAQSRLRHALGLDISSRRKRIGVRAHFRLPRGQRQMELVDVYYGHGHEIYVTPLQDGELLVAALAHADTLNGRIQEVFRRWYTSQPELAKMLEAAERISDLRVVSPLSGHARRGFLPGFVLLGDAAGFIDPITGGGMTQALLSAELLAGHVANGIAKDDTWLAAFDRERQALLRDYRLLTKMVLWLSEHPRLVSPALQCLRLMPSLFSHLLAVSGGVRQLRGGPLRLQAEFLSGSPRNSSQSS